MNGIVKDSKLESLQIDRTIIIPLSDIVVPSTPNPAKGKFAYNKNDDLLYYADGSQWQKLLGESTTFVSGDVIGPITNVKVVKINDQSIPAGEVTGQILQYNQSTNSWELNSNTEPSDGQILQYTFGKWIPTTPSIIPTSGNVALTYPIPGVSPPTANNWNFFTSPGNFLCPPPPAFPCYQELSACWLTFSGHSFVDVRFLYQISQTVAGNWITAEFGLPLDLAYLGVPLWNNVSAVPGGDVPSPPSATTTHPINIIAKVRMNTGYQGYPDPVWWSNSTTLSSTVSIGSALTYTAWFNFSYTSQY